MTKWRTATDPAVGDRARIECMDERASDLIVEVIEQEDAQTGERYWAVVVRPFGPRVVRVFAEPSLEPVIEWAGEEWG